MPLPLVLAGCHRCVLAVVRKFRNDWVGHCLHRAFRTIACAGSTGREAFEAGFRPLKAELAFASAVTEAWQSKARLTESGTLSKRSACACSLPNLRKACARGRWRRRPDRAA